MVCYGVWRILCDSDYAVNSVVICRFFWYLVFGCLVYNCYASLVCVFWMICCGIAFILVWLCGFCLFEFCGCLNYCSCLRVG